MINKLPGMQERKCEMAAAVVLGGTLYGAEVDAPTVQQISTIRRIVAGSIWGSGTNRNHAAALMLFRSSVDPHVAVVNNIVKHWAKMIRHEVLDEDTRLELWTYGREDNGTVKGPVHQVARIFKQLGVTSEDGRHWTIGTQTYDGAYDACALNEVVKLAETQVWKTLAKHRHHFNGLQKRTGRRTHKEFLEKPQA